MELFVFSIALPQEMITFIQLRFLQRLESVDRQIFPAAYCFTSPTIDDALGFELHKEMSGKIGILFAFQDLPICTSWRHWPVTIHVNKF